MTTRALGLEVVILAAGFGKRMQSSLPKVLHPLGGKPLLAHVLQTVNAITDTPITPIVICSDSASLVKNTFSHLTINWVHQAEQRGTAHALMQALPLISDDQLVLVLYGDVPLISAETLKKLVASTPAKAIGMVTKNVENPHGYGRIIRDQLGNMIAITEQADLSQEEQSIREINTGIYLFPAHYLKCALPQIKNHNQQNELYLTDLISSAVQAAIPIHSISARSIEEIAGVNDRSQLARLERYYQQQQAEMLMQRGVTVMDPTRLDIRGDVTVGRDVTLDINVILEGKVTLGHHCKIGPHTYLKNVTCHDHAVIHAHCVLEDATVGAHTSVGPFARIRPGTIIQEDVHIGNFVEIKNSHIDQESKVNHLSYVGDSKIGQRVNIGAGTITCNYDGAIKHRTIIHHDVHIGSGTKLIAPVEIGAGATIGAGSIITENVVPNKLTLTHHLKQRSIENWKRPKNEE